MTDHDAPSGVATRILFVLPRMVAGGVERATLNLIEGLREHGIDCRIALGRCRGELLDEARRLAPVDEVARHGNLRFPFGLAHVLRDYRPTHIVTAFVDVTLLTWLAQRIARSNAALIIGVHGTLQSAAAIGNWRVRLRYWLHRWISGPVYRRCAAVVAVSAGVADDVRTRDPSVAPVLHVIHNPVFSAALRRHIEQTPPASSAHSRPTLVALGRLAYEKGFDVLLRAMPPVLARFPEAQLVIHGEGAERAALQALIATLGLRACVRLPGTTLDPPAAIASADVFVFPSRNEGFGVALVEALACGRQIVASDCPHGPADILCDGKFGQLVPPQDAAALARAICRSLAGEVAFAPQPLRARAAEFSAETAVASWTALLRACAPAARISRQSAAAR